MNSKVKNLLHYPAGFLVDYQLVFDFRVFPVPDGSIGADTLSCGKLCFESGLYLFRLREVPLLRPEKGAAYDRTERDAHRAPEPRQYYHDAEKRADYCCGVIFQSQQHRNIPRQAAQDDTCRQFVFICV